MQRFLLGSLLLLLAESAWGAISVDATVSKDQSSANSSIIAQVTTNSGNELLLALVSADYLSGANTTVTNVSGAGLTWQLVVRTNGQSGTSEIWRAFAPTTLSNATVTASLSHSVLSSMTVMSFTGVDTSGSNGAGAIGATASQHASSGAPSAALVTTRNNSWVFGVGNDYDNAIARRPGAGQGLAHQFLTPAGDTYWVQMLNGPTTVSGTTVTINDTSPTGDQYNLSICEILPAISSESQRWTISGMLSPAAGGSGATVALSGASSATVLADASGNYSFPGLSNGNYTVTPTSAGYSFAPSSQSVTLNGADVAAINFTAQLISQTWNISGTLSPASIGSGATVTLSGATSATVTADSSGNYSFTGVGNGNYSITPTKANDIFTPASQPATVSGANVTGVDFSGQSNSTPNALAIDAKISKDQGTSSASVTSPSFSTTSGSELLLAFVSADYLGGANTTVKAISGAGLAWELVVRTNGQSGSSEIWRAFAPSVLSNTSVTATLSQSVPSSLTVMSFTGADGSGVNGAGAIGATGSANASSGAPIATLVTTRNGSWVLGVGNDFDNAIARTPAAGQTVVHQDLTTAGDTYWVQMQTAVTSLAGSSVSINDTAPTKDRYNLSIVEVMPALAGGSGGATPPTVTMASPAPDATVAGKTTVSAAATSQNYPVLGVQFVLDGVNLGSEVTSAPYAITWDTSSAATGQHTLAAVARNSAGLSATSSPVTVSVDNSGNPLAVGSWSGPVSLPAVAVNLILLANNKVLFYQDGATPTTWDYVTNKFTNVATSADLFCSGHSMLADGRILIAGGYGEGSSSIGISSAEIFDPSNDTWTTLPNMAYRRWYPTATTLSDGKVLVTAGWQTTEHTNAGIPEIYDPVTNKWTSLTNANNPFETYPFIFQLSDGRVIHVGGSEYATDTEALDLNSQTWSVVDGRIVDGGSATMYLPNKIMKAGSASDSQNSGPSSNTTFVLDMTQQSPTWKQTPSMAYPRSYLNLTTLPDGAVLATGGETDKNGGNIANAVYPAELWSPQTETWTTMASMHTPREYHSTALLLPDGRVLQSGMGADFGNVPNEMTAEFFSPPYLFKGPRPVISQAPSQIHYGAAFFVATPDAASIAKAVLIRTGAVTHFFDQNTRYVPVTFQPASGGLTLTAPANGFDAPPGYYMLFLVNNSGVPSIAPFVQLTQ